jgi:hypothetical protein
MGEGVSFQPLFKNIGEKLAFQICGIQPHFLSKFKNSTSGWLLRCTCTVHYSQREMERVIGHVFYVLPFKGAQV